MRPVELRALGVALTGMGALLRAGVPAGEAVRAVATDRVLATRLTQAATRIDAGRDVAQALAEAFPALVDVIGVSDAGLPDRLIQAAELCVRRYSLARRVRAAGLYPVSLGLGLLLVGLVIWWAQSASVADLMQAGEGRQPYYLSSASLTPIALVAIGFGATIGALWMMRQRRAPRWLAMLPGARVYALANAADFLMLYASLRDPGVTDLGPAEAAARLGGATPDLALAARHAQLAAPIRALADAAPDPSAALRDAAARFDGQAAFEARRLAALTSTVLLLVVAAGVLLMGLQSLYQPIFAIAGGAE